MSDWITKKPEEKTESKWIQKKKVNEPKNWITKKEKKPEYITIFSSLAICSLASCIPSLARSVLNTSSNILKDLKLLHDSHRMLLVQFGRTL